MRYFLVYDFNTSEKKAKTAAAKERKRENYNSLQSILRDIKAQRASDSVYLLPSDDTDLEGWKEQLGLCFDGDDEWGIIRASDYSFENSEVGRMQTPFPI